MKAASAERRSRAAQIRVLLVDDHPIAVEGIKACLALDPSFVIVGQAANGAEGIEKAHDLRPDVVLMDLSMPRMSGLEAARIIMQTMPGMRILLMSGHESREYAAEAVRCGARGFLAKDANPCDFVIALRAVFEGKEYFHFYETMPIMREEHGRSRSLSAVQAALSEREIDTLRLITNGMTNKEIASKLNVSVRTVEKHRGSIMMKLNLHSVAELTKFALREGMAQF